MKLEMNTPSTNMLTSRLWWAVILGFFGIGLLFVMPKSNPRQYIGDIRVIQRQTLLTVMSNLSAADLSGIERVSKSENNIKEEDIVHIILKDGAYVAVAYWDKDGHLKSMFK